MGSLSAIVVGNVSGMEQKKVESKVGEGIVVKVKGRKWKRYCFYKIGFFKYTVPVCYHEVVHFCEVVRIRDG